MQKQKKSQLITFQSKIDRGLADDLVVIMRKEGKSRRRMLEEFIHWCKYEHAKSKGLLTSISEETERADIRLATGE